jgi:hypothetical protein
VNSEYPLESPDEDGNGNYYLLFIHKSVLIYYIHPYNPLYNPLVLVVEKTSYLLVGVSPGRPGGWL